MKNFFPAVTLLLSGKKAGRKNRNPAKKAVLTAVINQARRLDLAFHILWGSRAYYTPNSCPGGEKFVLMLGRHFLYAANRV
jgi:hypothetical protein